MGVPRTVVVLALGAFVAACGDVGDDATPHPPMPFSGVGADAGVDGSVMTDTGDDGSSDGAGPGDDALVHGPSPGETVVDGASGSNGEAADGAEDAPLVAVDAEEEAEGADARTVQDATSETTDAATLDAPPVDAAGDADATFDSDAGGSPDSTAADATSGADTSTGGDGAGGRAEGGGLGPCTSAGQQGCVQCEGNSPGNVCTPTEALIVEYDIRKGFVTAPGPDGDVTDLSTSCYACLVASGYVDDVTFGDTGKECGDLSGSFTAGNGYSGPAVDICLATLACILSTDCSAAAGGALACYCGAGGGSPTECKSNGAATNGACKTQMVDGYSAQPDDALTISNEFTTPTYPSGLADNIFVQAKGVCDMCLQ